jgi:hypothetical protein
VNLYVAGASAEIERAETFIAAARGMDYAITFDWPAAIRTLGKGANVGLDDKERRLAKWSAYEAAKTCDVFVLLLPSEPVATIGAWCELGAATVTRWNVKVGYPSREFLLVGEHPERTVFAVDLPHYATDADALEQLREMVGA